MDQGQVNSTTSSTIKENGWIFRLLIGDENETFELSSSHAQFSMSTTVTTDDEDKSNDNAADQTKERSNKMEINLIDDNTVAVAVASTNEDFNDDDDDDVTAITFTTRDTVAPDTKQQQQQQQQQQHYVTEDTAGSKEEFHPLLQQQQGRLSSSSWILESPYWSLSSRTLLEITYRPSWQGLPEYTSMSSSADCARQICRGPAGCCGDRVGGERRLQRPAQFETLLLDTDDIQRVQQIGIFKIRGIGPCRGLRVHLKQPKQFVISKTTKTQTSTNQQQQQQTPPTTTTNTTTTDPYQKGFEKQRKQSTHNVDSIKSDWNRLHEYPVDSLPHDSRDFKDDGPIITFAMPFYKSQQPSSPPLLWKVEFPTAAPHICLETITVLNGTLHPRQNRQPKPPRTSNIPTTIPSHIYLHGWQSWTFAGTVRKGTPQPVSALPPVFSQAFNWGGSPPPPTSWDRKTQYQSDMFTCITANHDVDYQEQNREAGGNKNHPDYCVRALDQTGGPALVLGWLSQHEQFGLLQVSRQTLTDDLQMHASCDGILWTDLNTDENNKSENSTPRRRRRMVCTDWSYAQLLAPHEYDEEPMAEYLTAVAAHNRARPLQNGPLLTGWCSWYHYKERITAAKLRENFFKLKNTLGKHIPTNVVVVDDGYMTAWGDWNSLKQDKSGSGSRSLFPHGMEGVAQDILAPHQQRETSTEQQQPPHETIRPGIWLAPFACDKHSELAKQHPDWVIRNNNGRVANSSNCGKFFYGLDATNPHVRDHVYTSIRRAVHDWGYRVLKIDFLYAACLVGNGKYDLSMTRAQAMHLALQTIRAAAGPDVFLIGCGCPMGSGIGYADGMRVTADTEESWHPSWPMPYWDNGTLPSLRSMVRNSMTRACLGHRWWHNDPDCLLVGTTTKLSDIEIMTAASVVAMTCGMFLLSDDLSKVPMARLKIVTKIFPMTGATAVVLDTHCTNEGLPSLMRLWCTDRYQPIIRPEDLDLEESSGHNHEATLLGRYSSFSPDEELPVATERKRNCIHVPKGLGTWTLLSVSNLLDNTVQARVPWHALLPPPEKGWEDDHPDAGDHGPIQKAGFHVLEFWSGVYCWIPDPRLGSATKHYHLTKSLRAHETEIFHIKAVQPSNKPAYLGSSLHFSCGYEVDSLEMTDRMMAIQLRSGLYREGHIYIYVPRPKLDEIKIRVSGRAETAWKAIGNTPQADDTTRCVGRAIRVPITIEGDGSNQDGRVEVHF